MFENEDYSDNFGVIREGFSYFVVKHNSNDPEDVTCLLATEDMFYAYDFKAEYSKNHPSAKVDVVKVDTPEDYVD